MIELEDVRMRPVGLYRCIDVLTMAWISVSKYA
jgi:hypothetical protein